MTWRDIGRLTTTIMAALTLASVSTRVSAQPPADDLHASTAPVEGEALSLPQTLALGRPAHAIAFHIDAEAPALVAQGRGAPARVDFDAAPTSTIARLATLPDGLVVAIVSAEMPGDTQTSVWSARGGRPWLVWQGRTALRGDLGERHADAVRALLHADGRLAGLVFGTVYEPTRVCGRSPALLDARGFTSAQGLAPIRLARLDPSVPTEEVTAEVVNERPATTTALRALQFFTASSASVPSAEGLRNLEAGIAPAPVALADGDESTGWRPSTAAQTPFVSARLLDRTLRIETVELSLGLPDATPAAAIRSLWLVDETHALHVQVPAGARRIRIAPTQPLSGACLSIILDQTESSRASGPAAITEVRALTQLDRVEGRRALLGDLAEGGERRAHAVRLLAALGRPALAVLLSAYPDMPAEERRAALTVACARLGDFDEAVALLLLGVRGDDAELAMFALEQLASGLPGTSEALGQTILLGGETGTRAATLLARGAPSVALPVLLSQLDAAGDEPAYRRALATAATHASELETALGDFLDSEPSPHALACAAQALAGRVPAPLPGRVVDAARSGATEFAHRYRVALAMSHMPSDAEGDAWLVQQSQQAEEWMMRAAGLRALEARHSDLLVEAARGALTDDYPRVRAVAASVLLGQPEALVPLATMARRDTWPRARAAAVAALTPDHRARRILRAALSDPAQRVRATAARGLGSIHDTASAPALIARLEATGEWPEVLSASIGALSAMCVDEATPALIHLIDRTHQAQVWEPDREVAAAAIAGLGWLGDSRSTTALRRLVNDADPALAEAARQALAAGSHCHPSP